MSHCFLHADCSAQQMPRFFTESARVTLLSMTIPSSSPSCDAVVPDNTGASRAQTRALVTGKREVAPRHFELSLCCAAVSHSARAGQFVHLLPQSQTEPEDQNWSFEPLLRRAFSVMDTHGDDFEILFRVEGRGTQLLSRARAGEWLDLIGPLGNGFTFPNEMTEALLVGGGVGVPPMVLAARRLRERGVAVRVLIGARSSKDVLCESRFEALDVPLDIATDDGSRGHHGRVDVLLARALEENPNAPVFACGPYLMLRTVSALCEAKNVACEVSLEENMPCGIGVCNGCVVAMRPHEDAPGDDYGRYKRICVHGPACDAREIDWT